MTAAAAVVVVVALLLVVTLLQESFVEFLDINNWVRHGSVSTNLTNSIALPVKNGIRALIAFGCAISSKKAG